MRAWHDRVPGTVTEDKLLQAVNILADIVENDGAAFRPLYLHIRQRLAELRSEQNSDAAEHTQAIASKSKVA